MLPKEQFIRLPVRRQRLRPGPRLRRYGAKNGYLTVLGDHTAKEVANDLVHVLDFVVVDEPSTDSRPYVWILPNCPVRRVVVFVYNGNAARALSFLETTVRVKISS
jgi:hypothetical protein